MPRETRKTTITIPANVLKALRMYIVRENLGFHDQSKVIVIALIEYLSARAIPIDEENEDLIEFVAVAEKDQS